MEQVDNGLLTVQFSDGNTYGIQIDYLANARAQEFAGKVTDATYSDDWWAEFDRVYKESMEDVDTLTLWLRTNVSWEDVEEAAIILFDETVTERYAKEWATAPMEVVTVVNEDLESY